MDRVGWFALGLRGAHVTPYKAEKVFFIVLATSSPSEKVVQKVN